MQEPTSPFEVASSFEAGEVQAGVRLGRLEAQYEELFAEVIEDGVITPEERARLDRAADALGLDRARSLQPEQALTAAYEARRRVRVREPDQRTLYDALRPEGLVRPGASLSRESWQRLLAHPDQEPAVLRIEDPYHADERMDDLLHFAVGERYANLRKQLGVTVG